MSDYNPQPQSNPPVSGSNYQPQPNDSGAYAQQSYPQGPAQGYPQPQPHYQPHPQHHQPSASQMVVVHDGGEGRGAHCMVCGRQTDNLALQKSGCVVWGWCIGLFLFTGCLCCIPFCIDSCKDTEVRCARCQTVKSVIPASCCG